MLKVAVIGTGVIGQKRAQVVRESENSQLCLVCDTNLKLVRNVAKQYGCNYTTDWKEVVSEGQIDVVIVSTVNKYLSEIAIESLDSDKHVLVEKPPGRTPIESSQLVEAENRSNKKLKVGFNHRYHPAYIKLVQLINADKIGEVYYIRANYGHGGAYFTF